MKRTTPRWNTRAILTAGSFFMAIADAEKRTSPFRSHTTPVVAEKLGVLFAVVPDLLDHLRATLILGTGSRMTIDSTLYTAMPNSWLLTI